MKWGFESAGGEGGPATGEMNSLQMAGEGNPFPAEEKVLKGLFTRLSILVSRRTFLGRMAAGIAFFAAGGLPKVVWPTRGSDKGSVRLVFYTDVHARTEWDTPSAMERAARAINARQADLVLAGGDLITEGFESSSAAVVPRWDAYMEMHRRIKADIYPAIGNHDLVAAIPNDGTPPAADPRAVFRTRMELDRTTYSFDAVGYHFIMLDAIRVTGDETPFEGRIGEDELEWLNRDLSRLPRNTPIVIVTHIPLLTAFYSATRGATVAPGKNRIVVNNRDVLKLINSHHVILVLQGHLHVKESLRWQNTTYITGGAVSGKWWRGPLYGTEEGFNVITLTDDHIGWEYIDYGWQARRPKRR
ncbi:metallophosphoesterase family protein [Thermodesulfobacteriota bacterium]